MAKYHVNIAFPHKGKQYSVGDEITMNQTDAERHLNLGFIKEAKAATKAPTKKASAAKKAASKAAPKDETTGANGEIETTE